MCDYLTFYFIQKFIDGVKSGSEICNCGCSDFKLLTEDEFSIYKHLGLDEKMIFSKIIKKCHLPLRKRAVAHYENEKIKLINEIEGKNYPLKKVIFVKKQLVNLLNFIEDIKDRVPEGDYLSSMNLLKNLY